MPIYLFDQAALYARESDLRIQNLHTGQWNGRIGQGLFTASDISVGEAISYYKGEIITPEENTRRIAQNPERDGYQIKLSKKFILDCFDEYKKGRCMASFANDYRNCLDITTGVMAQPNAKLIVVNRRNMFNPSKMLRYAYLLATEPIPAFTEVVCYYGLKFELPLPIFDNFIDLTIDQ